MDTKITSNISGQIGRVDAGRADAVDALGRPKKKENGNIDSSTVTTPLSDYDVSVSNQARAMAEARAKALQIAKNTPDVRADRVAALRQQIQDGTYKVDSGKVADGIMREALIEKLAESEE
jgi:negative regulator of flagellin synthesis FlgM